MYALDIIGDVDAATLETAKEPSELQKVLLNGADNWRHYSEGGCSLVYDEDIAERLCTPSELKRCKGGLKAPNARETWFGKQARALYQAWFLIKGIVFAR